MADRCLDGGGGFFAGDTRACRQMHLQLALLDPIGHCPHLGPDSEKCTAEARSGRRVTAYCDRLAPPLACELPHATARPRASGAAARAAAPSQQRVAKKVLGMAPRLVRLGLGCGLG